MPTVKLHVNAPLPAVPLVLLSPFPLDARIWDDVAEELGPGVVTVDPPGFGGETDDPPSLEGYADAVLSALDELGVTRFAVAGNSMGGYVAMCLAEVAPERVAAIGLVGTKSTADDETAAAGRLDLAARADTGASAVDLVGGMWGKLLGETSQVRRTSEGAWLRDALAAAPTDGIAWAARAMAGRPDRTDVLRALGAAGVPGAVLWGVEEVLMPPEIQAEMAEALGVMVERIPQCGHLPPLEAPGATAMILEELWARVR